MQLTKVTMPTNKYSIKCPYSMTPTRIVVHNTANDASAMSEISYMIGNNNQVSYHYAVDDYRVVQGIEENRNGWHAGDGRKGKGNREGIGIEICYSKSGGDRFLKAEDNAVELIVSILKRYGWGIEKVTKHQDYMNKYCPHRTLDLGWERFMDKIKARLNETNQSTTVQPTPTNTGFNAYTVKINTAVLNVRDGAGTNYKINTTVKKGEVYTIVDQNGDWGKLKSGAGWIKLSYTVKTSGAAVAQPTTNYYPKCSSNHTSIVNALKEVGVDSSFSNRKKIAQKNGYSGNTYTGTPAQNVDLLNKLKQGKLIK